MKEPSPEANPAIQYGSIGSSFVTSTKGLSTGIWSGKASFLLFFIYHDI
jgi:hypothetical protein